MSDDDTIPEDEVIGEFKIFKYKVRPLSASSLRTLSQEEKRLVHWYILNSVDEISKYRKYYVVILKGFRRDKSSATPTPRRRAQSRLLELECYVAANGRIPMSITPGAEKHISPNVDRFSHTIGMCVQKIFPVCCLKWTDVGREYIKVVNGDL
ncbi:CACTA en-spm transposon protein [Cucumis melo var. makuwa]|uniref:CACTA en-spm transposon protein n=1 Tax=Cucumis melo var. makuwa TaxID=1194695 RepID=A0A5A7SXJ4_CUCMM|nr:CACTA en-spm transposon protein [Cucumis melo var. makuwa]TYK02558.1 CACTA en-spm transposon protein [Cucumis melo var. makuwa]